MNPHREKVNVANGYEVYSEGIGTVSIQLINEAGKESKIKVSIVLFIPKIAGKLLSVKKLAEKGIKAHFKSNLCELIFQE